MNTGATAQQALYGYQDGHRLLAASTELAPSDRRLLLRQTDSPDAGTTDGWTELLAGYPLPSGRFAWSMTWPASEMPRPGCVWTHVLILDEPAVADVGQLAVAEIFRRPRGPEPDIAPYRRPLALPAHRRGGSKAASKEFRRVLAALAWAFFEPPTRPVRMGRVVMEDQDRHKLLTAAWALAWPELRQTMSLADAPVTPRQLPTQPFDLQLQRSARRKPDEGARVIEGLPATAPPRWADALAEAALHPGGLADFLSTYGPECPRTRDSVVPLVQTWLIHQSRDQVQAATQVLDLLSGFLPDGSEGKLVKRALLRPKGPPVGCPRALDEIPLLRALVSADSLEALRLDDFDVGERTRTVVKQRPAEVSGLLDAVPARPNAAAEQLLDALADALTNKQLKGWLAADPEGVSKLLRLRPLLATEPAVWTALDPGQAWQAIRRVRGKKQQVELAAAVVAAGGDLDPGRVAEAWKGTLLPIVQRLADDHLPIELLGGWLDQLSVAQQKELAGDAVQYPELVAAVVERTEPTQLATWDCPLLTEILVESSSPLVHAHVLLAALDNTQHPAWALLAIQAYQKLYRQAIDEALDPVRPLLADLAKDEAEEWDVAARLAKTLNKVLKQSRWPVLAALECRDQQAFAALVNADERAGLARKILAPALEEPTELLTWQREALFAAVKERADRDGLIKVFEVMEGVVAKAWKLIQGS